MAGQNAQLQRNEACRREVRAWLAVRPDTANLAARILRSLQHTEDADWTPDEVTAALAFLKSKGDVIEHSNPDGAARYFAITAQGTLAAERSGP